MKVKRTIFICVSILLMLSATNVIFGGGQGEREPKTLLDDGKIGIYTVLLTPLEEPWPNVIHQGCLKAAEADDVSYEVTDNVPSADYERVLRELAETGKYDIIICDAFGHEELCRRVAKDYPDIAFVGGSDGQPAAPNFSVFGTWIHEPCYLCGMLAGMLTKTNIVGGVGAYPVPSASRLLNGFYEGAKSVNPDIKVKSAFIDSWYDPAKTKEAALAQIEAGADALLNERYGVIEAAQKEGVLAFGMMEDQSKIAPETVVASAIFNLDSAIQHIVDEVRAGTYEGHDLKPWVMMAKGGAKLVYNPQFDIPQDIKDAVEKKKVDIMNGVFVVPNIESSPKSD